VSKPVIGSAAWNDRMYRSHRTPYDGLAGVIERARLRWVLRWARALAPTRVLDVGCGEGVLLDAFGDGVQVIGVDVSGDSLRACHRDHPTREVIQANGTQGLPFDSRTFDLVLCTEVLEHVPEPARLISELWRVCAPNGRAILTVPIERLKLAAKAILRWTPLFRCLFPGIEPGFSAWHLHDFDRATLYSLLRTRFEIESARCVWGLHRCLLLRPAATVRSVHATPVRPVALRNLPFAHAHPVGM